MKKLCVFYSNCQSTGIAHFLKKTPFGDEYEFSFQNNWQIILGELPREGLLDALSRADLVLYQPTPEFQCTDGVIVPASWSLLLTHCKIGSKIISFPYCYNTGFFPLLRMGNPPNGWETGRELKERAKSRQAHTRILQDYNAGNLHWDCTKRFLGCLAEQQRREMETDVQVVPFILSHCLTERLFLTFNHPTSALFQELAAQIYNRVMAEDVYACFMQCGENEAGMNGSIPIHPTVCRELGLEYPPDEGAHDFYRQQLEMMLRESV